MTTSLKLPDDIAVGQRSLMTVVQQAAPPLLVSDTTAEREGFPSARAWRKFARAAAARGLPVAELGAELVMAREDVLAALRGAASAAPTPTVEPVDDFESATLAAAAASGLKLVGGRR